MEKYLWLYITIGVILLAVLIYSLVTAKRRKKARLLGKIRSAYGVLPKREYSAEELNKIRSYFEQVKGDGYYVDDITWNDLDMDSVFIAMNHTFSSAGEEVLYDLLREPVFDADELAERERVTQYFLQNDPAREAFQIRYASIGRTRKFSLVEFLGQFRELELKDDLHYLLRTILLVIAIGSIFINVLLGILALLGVMVFNIYKYYKEKADVEPYYISLAAIAALIDGADQIGSQTLKELDPVKEYILQLRDNCKPVRSLKLDMKWLGSGTVAGASGDIMQIVLDYLRMITHLDFLKFNRMVRKVINCEEKIMNLYRTMGFLEAMIAVGSYRQTIPFSCAGEFCGYEKKLAIKDEYHPLIKEPVANSFSEERSLLLTGSNASGKSTFLRTTALSVLMAQTVNTVHAHSYKGGFFRIYSSMALRDDIESAQSYFIVEITSLKRIMDAAAEDGAPVLAFVDEVLRGTNTVERIAASSEILRDLSGKNAMLVTATHDIELTELLSDCYSNYHFEEEIVDGEIRFNYILKKGKATTRNAIKLLSVMGYGKEVVTAAEKTAERFMEEGVWTRSPK
ncbi:MAG: hypothetical protein IKS18_07730 [Lachnospiraceae bacterium]|nr:hypothetical protein [Lachnospiraceae bacterium]